MGPALKRRKTSKVEEVSFDAADREEFLTGFRKRKQQRIKHAQEIAIKRAKEEKRQDRKKVNLNFIRTFQPCNDIS
jgi:ribosomal RNA-processing protein 17